MLNSVISGIEVTTLGLPPYYSILAIQSPKDLATYGQNSYHQTLIFLLKDGQVGSDAVARLWPQLNF
jgi:hypothetical protein